MNKKLNLRRPSLNKIFKHLLAGIIFILSTECAPSGAQVEGTGWQAKRYMQFEKAEATTDATKPKTLQVLSNTLVPLTIDGYIKTDITGQAEVRKQADSTCVFYIFQGTTLIASSQAMISTCPRGSTSTNCSSNTSVLLSQCGIALVTLPATITSQGTAVTIIEFRELEAVLVIVANGTATITPIEDPVGELTINNGEAVYVVTQNFVEDARVFFGFESRQIVSFQDVVPPIQKGGVEPQIQRANIILYRQGFPMVPLPEPYQLGIDLLNQNLDNTSLTLAISQAIDWNSAMNGNFSPQIPIRFMSGGQNISLRSIEPNISESLDILRNSNISTNQILTIAYDESIPGMVNFANKIQQDLTDKGLFNVNLMPYTTDNSDVVFTDIESSGTPALIMGEYYSSVP